MGEKAFVVVQTEAGKAAQVATEVSQLDGVVSAEALAGPYDVVALVEAESMDELGRMVVCRLQLFDGVTRTLTCPIVRM